jgi:hypothetical protein
MTAGEAAYLVLVLLAFGAFALSLFIESRSSH